MPEVTKFWKRVGDNFEELYDWDISDSFGEAIDTAARIAILPIITLIGMAAAACDFIDDHLAYRDNILSKISDYNKKLKEELWKSESNIKRLFSERVRQIGD